VNIEKFRLIFRQSEVKKLVQTKLKTRLTILVASVLNFNKIRVVVSETKSVGL
jgi:hypothetical protein